MTETAALLADEVLPQKPLRQWVLSLPFALRFLLATDADALTRVLGIVHRAISGYLLRKAKLQRAAGATGAVTLIQRLGSALNLNHGTTHIVLEPLDFMARLAALVPPPRVHQTRYHGVLAPNSALRAAVTPSRARPRRIEAASRGGAGRRRRCA